MSVKTLYNPAGLEKPELIESFVVRTKIFEKIFSDIKSSDMKYPEKHYLIQGQRGMGKTTLLLRLKYEIENSGELNNWLLPVFFGEESYDLTTLSRLWEKLLDYLDDALDTNGEHFEHTEAFIDFEDYEKKCFDYLIEVLQKNQKKLIIFFDNFGQLFLDNLKDKEKRRLREILMHCSEIRIIGASAIVLQDLHDYSEPFYEFFQIVRLEGLTKEETFHLIEKLQEKSKQKINLKKAKGKIDTLAILTGGVIRTLMMVYQVLLEDQDGSALNDLETILDQITPLYKSRIEELPVQQRRIVDVIAKNWDAISAKDIATQIREDGKRIQTKLVSAHLAQLEKNNVIEKKQTNTKNHLYQVRERFFNIWYLMRNGNRRDRKKVKWLTKFLEMWYDDEESINSFIERHISHLKSGKYHPKSALLLAEALVDSEKIDVFKLDVLIKETSGILSEEQKSQLPDIERRKFSLAKRYYDQGDLEGGIDVLERIPKRSHYQRILLTYFYLEKKDLKNALKEFESISEISIGDLKVVKFLSAELKKPDVLEKILNNSPKISKGKSFLTVAEAYLRLNKKDLAEVNFKKAIAENEEEAFLKLADFYEDVKNFEKAEFVLKAGLKSDAVSVYDLLDFYLLRLPTGKEDIQSAGELLLSLPESDLDYFFYKSLILLIELGSSVEEPDYQVKAREFQIFLERACTRFNEEKVYDEREEFITYNLLTSYLQFSLDKKKARNLMNLVLEREKVPNQLLVKFSFLMTWERKFKEAIELIENQLHLDEVFKDSYLIDQLNTTILLLLAKDQYHLVFGIFSKFNEFKEVLKPTYYALMTLLKEEYPNELVKMGDELTQPVNDILYTIKEMKLKYE
ncbi:winged-helix domain-containing protein [Mongoliitalea daihaiensis]|uniref:winged-helix domain-containing protein n=1 Tax=Mongoliitalea daihaiensis TaxID=2782006 RepID=UPI001F45287B|nr:winged-helix domain-containing protein [Mongoliitalea daihaiensis]UJP65812.1 hypothetical protein IPZ59_04090 [Mongoliitalea daihaiensis]